MSDTEKLKVEGGRAVMVLGEKRTLALADLLSDAAALAKIEEAGGSFWVIGSALVVHDADDATPSEVTLVASSLGRAVVYFTPRLAEEEVFHPQVEVEVVEAAAEDDAEDHRARAEFAERLRAAAESEAGRARAAHERLAAAHEELKAGSAEEIARLLSEKDALAQEKRQLLFENNNLRADLDAATKRAEQAEAALAEELSKGRQPAAEPVLPPPSDEPATGATAEGESDGPKTPEPENEHSN